MECEFTEICWFIDFLKRKKIDIELKVGECPKKDDCLRLNGLDENADINTPKLVSYEETEIAKPIIYTDEHGKGRRV